MSTLLPSTRLDDFPFLTPEERQAIRSLGGPVERLDRSSTIRWEGSNERGAFLLVEGWIASSMVLRDGQRLIIKFHLAGDMLGSTSMCVDRALDTLTALTPVAVKRVSLDDLGRIMAGSANVAAFLLLSAQQERIALIDHLAWIARSSALARMASFYAEMFERTRRIDRTSENSFNLPLTQEQISDYLGLTTVHVNRTLRQLRNACVIDHSNHTVTIRNHAELRRLAMVRPRQMSSDFRWVAENANADQAPADEAFPPSGAVSDIAAGDGYAA